MTADKRSVHTDALETLGTIIGENEQRDAIHIAVEPVVAAEDLLPGQHIGRVPGGYGRSPEPLGIADPYIEGIIRKGQRFWLLVYPRKIKSLRHVWTHDAFDNVEDLPAKKIDPVKPAILPAPRVYPRKAKEVETVKVVAKPAILPAPRVYPRKAKEAETVKVVAKPAPAPRVRARKAKAAKTQKVVAAPLVSQVSVEEARINRSKEYIENLADSVDISYDRLMTGAADWIVTSADGGWGSYIVGGAEMEGTRVPDEFWMHYEIVTGEIVPDELRGSFFSCSC